MKSALGIISFGAYIPRKRLQRSAIHAANAWFAQGLASLAKGERSIGDWDEDSVTMAVEAARDTLVGFDRAHVESLSLASTTLPFIDRLNAGIVKEALMLPDSVTALDFTGSQRAGTSALLQALTTELSAGAARLCLASDMRRTLPASESELTNGDAAAGVLVGASTPVARFLGAHSVTIDFVDHYRSSTMVFDYTWESRWLRDEGYSGIVGAAIRGGLLKLGVPAESIDRFILPASARGVPQGLAKQAGIKLEAVADTLAASVGESGVAHPLLLLVSELERAKPGERILLVGFGQGVDVLLFEATKALKDLGARRGVKGSVARGCNDSNYMRWLFHRGNCQLDRGMRAELDQKQPGTTLYRHRKAVLGLVAGRCSQTGMIRFPRTNDSASHLGATQEDYCLAERNARVVSFTADSLSYSPNPPTYYGMIDFDGGGRMTVEFADVSAQDLEVGREMRMVFRIKGVDERRGFTKYFWKAAPAL